MDENKIIQFPQERAGKRNGDENDEKKECGEIIPFDEARDRILDIYEGATAGVRDANIRERNQRESLKKAKRVERITGDNWGGEKEEL